MYCIACPSCGADVSFRAASSVLAVCEYCRSTLVRDADSVRDIGKMAELLDDYSPLQITSAGRFIDRNFSIVGRIQLRYDAGVWNEWYLLFDDGSGGWLSESVGQYVLTLPLGPIDQAPAFDSLAPGQRYRYGSHDFVFSDVRQAQCVAGEGELPFRVGDGWQARVADARCQQQFLTLDYSDDPARPELFLGQAATLPQLNMQLLRDNRMIQEKTGKLKGSVATLACPGCAAPLDYRAGAAAQLTCGHCGSQTDVTGDVATVIGLHKGGGQAPALTLELGATAQIERIPWTLTGVMVWREDEDASSEWSEYLLYNVNKGFRWLVESGEGWFLGALMDVWVDSERGGYAALGQQTFSRACPDYRASVVYAAGAFPWRAKLGDSMLLSEYQSSDRKLRLSREMNAQELVWTRSDRVEDAAIGGWLNQGPIASRYATGAAAGPGKLKIALTATLVLLFINLPMAALGGHFGGRLLVSFIAVALLAMPLFQSATEEE
ncbi:DUF4178 domain-containing protein [Chromobacterium phragmitis]|uniref:DUF4178 domain-containing protein n=1 Tax=Chromobacterium phragmitis TaxID=2202141 RepID=A0ABV0IWH0_9NEIS